MEILPLIPEVNACMHAGCTSIPPFYKIEQTKNMLKSIVFQIIKNASLWYTALVIPTILSFQFKNKNTTISRATQKHGSTCPPSLRSSLPK